MRTPRREKERGHRAARARETANTGGWSVTQEAGVAERRTALDQVLGRADSKTALTMRGFHHGKHREEKEELVRSQRTLDCGGREREGRRSGNTLDCHEVHERASRSSGMPTPTSAISVPQEQACLSDPAMSAASRVQPAGTVSSEQKQPWVSSSGGCWGPYLTIFCAAEQRSSFSQPPREQRGHQGPDPET